MIDEHVVYDANEVNGVRFVNEGYGFFDKCISSGELTIFNVKNFQELLNFKWDTYGKSWHLVGFSFHCLYVCLITVYNYQIYIEDVEADQKEKPIRNFMEIALICGVLYPAIYDFTQMTKAGLRDYFSQFGNYLDMLYIFSSIANTILQKSMSSQAFPCKIAMMIIFLMQIHKTFFFLRIFEPVSYIVTMLYTVIWDLKVFMFFYFILIFLFSQVYSVFGLYNHHIQAIEGKPNNFLEYYNYVAAFKEKEFPQNFGGPRRYPGEEYKNIGLFLGSFLNVMRTSIGGSKFDAASYLSESENLLFWFIWLCIIVMTKIIMLNFVVAEACSSYNKIRANLEAQICQAKAELASEAEGMQRRSKKTPAMLPKYILVRHIET